MNSTCVAATLCYYVPKEKTTRKPYLLLLRQIFDRPIRCPRRMRRFRRSLNHGRCFGNPSPLCETSQSIPDSELQTLFLQVKDPKKNANQKQNVAKSQAVRIANHTEIANTGVVRILYFPTPVQHQSALASRIANRLSKSVCQQNCHTLDQTKPIFSAYRQADTIANPVP